MWVAGVLAACSPKQEAKAPPTQPAVAAPVVVEEPPDLSPVKRPAEVVLVGRLARPRLFAETLTQWSSLPVRIEDMLPNDARPLANAVLWEAPAELVVALDAFGEGKLPPPLVIGSIGLKSLDEALRAADALQMPTRKLAPGIYRVGDFAEASCAISVSLGAAPARLVCGRGTKDVDVLLPYATRGLPSEPRSGADLELTLEAGPLQERYGRDVAALKLLAGVAVRSVALDSPKFDRALSDAIYGAVDETIAVFEDLEQVRVEARLDGSRNVLTAATELKLKGSASWMAGTIAAAKPTPLPASLPRLPPGATLATYNTVLPAERYAALSRVLGELTEGYLEYEKVPEATRKRARRFTESWFAKLPEGFGFTMSPAQKDALGARHSDTTLMRITEPSPRILGMYADLFGLLGDASLKRFVKQKVAFKMDDKLWPKMVKKPFKLPGFKAPATLFEVTADLEAWARLDPSIEKLVKDMLPPPGSKELKRVVVVVQPDGEHTYVMTGDDPTELTRVMSEHRRAEPGMFFAKPAQNDKVLLAGFMTLTYLSRVIERSGKTDSVSKALAAAPNHGEVPIGFSTTVGPGTARADLEVPAAVFTDASAAIVSAGPSLKDALKDR